MYKSAIYRLTVFGRTVNLSDRPNWLPYEWFFYILFLSLRLIISLSTKFALITWIIFWQVILILRLLKATINWLGHENLSHKDWLIVQSTALVPLSKYNVSSGPWLFFGQILNAMISKLRLFTIYDNIIVFIGRISTYFVGAIHNLCTSNGRVRYTAIRDETIRQSLFRKYLLNHSIY